MFAVPGEIKPDHPQPPGRSMLRALETHPPRASEPYPAAWPADQHVREAAAREAHQDQDPILKPVPRAVFPQVAGLYARLDVE
jgi:hypothetical protein